nr:hypothetical protein [Tanacetum cinerariifolium]
MKKKTCFNCGDFNHLAYDCRKRVKKSFTPKPVAHRPYRPPLRPVRTNMNSARANRTSFNKQAHSYANRPFHRTSVGRSHYRAPWVPTINRNFPPINRKFSTGSRNFPTANRKFPTASRKFPAGSTKCSTADMGMKGKAVKPLACWFWKPLQNLSNKGPNNNNVSVMFKKYTYIDTQGRLKYKGCNKSRSEKNISSLRYIALPNWAHDALLESSLTDLMEILTVESPIPTVSSPVLTVYSTDSQEPSITTNSDESNGVEADISNMETAIIASPAPTLRIHKDHPKKPKKISDVLQDPSWVEAMQEELLQFKIQNVWTLVDCPKGMDVKSSFLYCTIDEEVYVMQPPGFQDLKFPVKVYKVEKAMYGLHQAPRAWYEGGWHFSISRQGKDETRKDVDLYLYRSMIGSLMYLTTSRPDIMFAVCAYARYLKGHPKLGLWYPKESPFALVAYSDSDNGGAT